MDPTATEHPHDPTCAAPCALPGPRTGPAGAVPTRRELRHLERWSRRTASARRPHRVAAVVAAVAAAGIAVPAVAQAGSPPVAASATQVVERPAVPVTTQALPGTTSGGAVPQATVEDESAWCAYLSSHYLTFPSPWSARVINCRSSQLFVAPVYSDGGLGMCVLVPARHSRHLGGNVARWVTDIRLC